MRNISPNLAVQDLYLQRSPQTTVGSNLAGISLSLSSTLLPFPNQKKTRKNVKSPLRSDLIWYVTVTPQPLHRCSDQANVRRSSMESGLSIFETFMRQSSFKSLFRKKSVEASDSNRIPQLSPIANSVVTRCSRYYPDRLKIGFLGLYRLGFGLFSLQFLANLFSKLCFLFSAGRNGQCSRTFFWNGELGFRNAPSFFNFVWLDFIQ